MIRTLLTLSLSLFLPIAAAAQGTLVIVGGGLQPETEAVYRAVLDRMPADGTLGVLPTASGVPEESGPLTVQDFEQYSGSEQKIELIDLRDGEVGKANDPAWAERIAACDALWFTGGDQSRIVSTLRHQPVGDTGLDLEDKPDTLAYAAVKSVFEKGGVVGGTSAGAAMMSNPMILWGTSHEALLVGVVNDVPDFGVGVGEGMGLLPSGIVDQHFRQRGRLGRLLVAMKLNDTGSAEGMGIDENTGIVLETAAGRIAVVGEGSVWRFSCSGPVDLSAPLRLTAAKMPSGFVMNDVEDLRALAPPTRAEIEELAAGAPRAYEGPPPFDVVLVGEAGLEGPVFELRPNDTTEPARAETQKQLEEARAKP